MVRFLFEGNPSLSSGDIHLEIPEFSPDLPNNLTRIDAIYHNNEITRN
jgi:hypothetical protein